MSDSIKGLTITLEKDMRDDDVEHVINAIKMIKYVQSVETSIVNPDDHMNRKRIRQGMREKLFDVLYD